MDFFMAEVLTLKGLLTYYGRRRSAEMTQ